VRERIQAELRRIEKEEDVRVLLAVESGSRAWGFASTDSDWDVRFVYLRRPEWYLTVRPGRDVLEYPITTGLDVSGWDFRKALGLFAKSNPPLLEWLRSPILYVESGSAAERLRILASEFYRPRACLHHYLHMAEGNFRSYLQGERVRPKKYFYVLRPVLACQWIERRDDFPPIEFERLVEAELQDPELREAVRALLEEKRSGAELDEGPRIPVINTFLEERIAHYREITEDVPRGLAPGFDRLDALFRHALGEAWGATDPLRSDP
jgi:predicted nucleotidyltransferase